MRYFLLLLLLFNSLALNADAFRDGVVAYQQKNFPKALATWVPLAEEGHVLAQTLVGSMYAYGEGVERDDEQAFKWLSRAANKGSAQAQYNLGILYENGFGTDTDRVLARKWFKAAADQGRKDAAARYALLEEAPAESVHVIEEEQIPEVNVSVTTEQEHPAPTDNQQRIHIVLNQDDIELLGPPSYEKDTPPNNNTSHGLDWARQQPVENYTIQLAASIEPRLVDAFKKHLKLTNQYAQTITTHNGHQWHALIYGSYTSVSEAKKAVDQFPASWKTWQPWIKRFSSISAIKH